MNRHLRRSGIVRTYAALLVGLAFLAQSAAAQNETAGTPTPLRIFLIGDSTVRNGKGDGGGGLWGWGNYLAAHFDTNKVSVSNRALGGRSSRTYFTEGLWEKVRTDLRPGDFVLMQFGHNDGGEIAKGDRPRASLKGNGDDSKDVVVEITGKPKPSTATAGIFGNISQTRKRPGRHRLCSRRFREISGRTTTWCARKMITENGRAKQRPRVASPLSTSTS